MKNLINKLFDLVGSIAITLIQGIIAIILALVLVVGCGTTLVKCEESIFEKISQGM